ncbi:MAG: hypothetical protein M3Z46_08765 [Actinomycetota bacterium]|nr:hypothetical protein [Actinomycetota bacterium]
MGQPTRRLSHRLYCGAVVGAVVPIVVAAVRGCLLDWAPVSDNGLVAVRSFDVLTRHPPLLGLWSSASLWSGVQFNLPGPLEFELLAVPVHVLGHRVGMALGMALINVAAVVATAVLARRRGGPLLAVVAMLFVVSLECSMGSEFLYDPWPINSAPFLFILFLFAAWSVADGDLLTVPVLAFTASYLVQTHLSYVIIVPVVGAVAVGGLLLFLRRRHDDDVEAWPALRRRAIVGLAASAVLTLALWAPPIYQQLTRHPGNLTQLAKASRATPPRPPDVRAAVDVVGSTVALPPWWLPPSYGSPSFDLGGNGRPLVLAGAGLVVMAAAGAALAGRAIRRRDRTTTAVLAVAAATLVAGLATVYKSPSPVGYHPNYLRWLWATSMFCWFAIAIAAVRLSTFSLLAERRRSIAIGLVTAVLVTSILTLPSSNRGVFARTAGPIADDLAKRALPQLGRTSPVLVQLDPVGLSGDVGPLILVALQRRGTDFVVNDTSLVHQLGDARRWNGHNARVTLRVDPDPLPPEGFRRIAQYYGLSRSEAAELKGLTSQVRRWLIATGGPRLSSIGQGLVAGNALRRVYFDHMRSLVRRPDSLMADPGFEAALAEPVTDHGRRGLFLRSDPLGDRKVMRWAELDKRSKAERVSIDMGPIPAAPR